MATDTARGAMPCPTEQASHNDLLLLPDFQDEYRRLSFKLIETLKWALRHDPVDPNVSTDSGHATGGWQVGQPCLVARGGGH